MPDLLYSVRGDSVDWVYANLGPRCSFTFELRPKTPKSVKRRVQFYPDATEIVKQGEELLAGLKVLWKDLVEGTCYQRKTKVMNPNPYQKEQYIPNL